MVDYLYDENEDDEELTGVVPILSSGMKTSTNTACLVVLVGAELGAMYSMKGIKTATVGRSAKTTIRLRDEGVSRVHCIFEKSEDGNIFIKDRESRNGTMVNGQRISSLQLNEGDRIQVGETILQLTYRDELEESFHRELYEAALKDGLTKIYNRKYFGERLAAEFAYAVRHSGQISLLMLDLDHFKNLNDTYGHPAGDFVLRSVVNIMQRTMRKEDVLARYGGEEFVVIARGIPIAHSVIFAERLRTEVAAAPVKYNDKLIDVTVSIGIAAVPHPAIRTPNDLVTAADKALYKAKHAGRNNVVVFSEE